MHILILWKKISIELAGLLTLIFIALHFYGMIFR